MCETGEGLMRIEQVQSAGETRCRKSTGIKTTTHKSAKCERLYTKYIFRLPMLLELTP